MRGRIPRAHLLPIDVRGDKDDERLMSFLAEAERTVLVSPEVAFDKLSDHASWASWMPSSFRPVGRTLGRLQAGDVLHVKIAGMPLPARLVVHRSQRPEEISWRGGVRGLLWAEHRFLFEPGAKGGTRIRSVETWHGAIARLARRAIQRQASRIGGEQLEGLARGLES
jgi:hypothetical protein